MSSSLSPLPLVLSFKAGISLHEQPEGDVFLQAPLARVLLSSPSKGILEALRVLSHEGAAPEQLLALVAQHDGDQAVPTMVFHLQRLIQAGLICHTITAHADPLATVVPTSPAYRFAPAEPAPNEPYSLSRFAYLHRERTQFVLESPLAHAKIVLHDGKALALLHALAGIPTLDVLCQTLPEIPRASTALFVGLLLSCALISRVNPDGEIQETPALTQWAFHDLLFHARSRQGRHANAYGATFRFLQKIEPLPAVKPPMTDEAICLYKPNLDALQVSDVPFTRVLETRRSIRKHGAELITVEQLGAFLYRTARIRTIEKQQEEYERSNRPYPGGGACYELEVYVVANGCRGLAAGLYHYDPQSHQLYRLTGRTAEVEALLKQACLATPQEDLPQLLIVLTARFQRVAWKYDAMAYAAILKHVGVLLQTMYLVATAMELAPCALGGGDADLFAAATGTDYYAETSVGEFILGSRPDTQL